VPEEPNSIASGTRGQFYTNWGGDIDRLSIPLEPTLPEDIVFTRVPEKFQGYPAHSGRRLFFGRRPVHVGLAGDALQLSIPGQPSYDLVPTRGLSFISRD